MKEWADIKGDFSWKKTSTAWLYLPRRAVNLNLVNSYSSSEIGSYSSSEIGLPRFGNVAQTKNITAAAA